MKIPSETLELIRARLDIVELVGEHVQLSRAGRNMKGRCPFHNEKTPSFIVSPERQTFHCFGCGEGGDAFSFVMKTDGLSFTESAEKLAARVGVKVEADKALGPEEKERLRAREALDFAADYYHELLKKDPAADAARAYVGKRKVNAAMLAQFKLGFAPRNGGLVAAAKKKGFDESILMKAGLAAKRADGTVRDYFFDRVLFPIKDAKGAVIGFGGRTMGDGEPKYLNSSDNPVFAKGRNLYGLHDGLPAVRKSRRALLMEGYMDVIAAHQFGFTTAVAPLGTALTPEQAALLKRSADSVVIVFDADNAGLNAAVRGAEVALQAGLAVRLTTVPDGKDPDELLHAKGAEPFAAALEAAKDPSEFKTDLLLSRAAQPLTPEAKSEIARSVLQTIALCGDEVLKDEWTRRLAQRLGVSEGSLTRSAAKAAPRRHAPPVVEQEPAPSSAPRRPAALPPADLQLLDLLVKAPSCAGDARDDDFQSDAARALAVAVAKAAPYTGAWAPRLLDALEDDGLKAVASRMLSDENLHAEPESHFRSVLERRRKERRCMDFKARVDTLSPDEMREYMRLMTELRGSKAAGRA
ncbi:MAG: DNA primase [Elusimicrobiota bacterium]|nr:DNA primase [Elusimicrobiota bacterium]